MKTIQTILHPTDFSESARPALALAVRLAEEEGARLIVLNVGAPTVPYGKLGIPIPVSELPEEILEADRIKLEALAERWGEEWRVVEGVTAAEIVRIAAEERCDLIVMGTHGRGGVARWLLGSVAADVLLQAPCPVLVVKPPGANARRSEEVVVAEPGAAARSIFPVILHPTDFREQSRPSFDSACALARGGGRLIVLHVVEGVHIASEGYEQALYERLSMFQTDDPSIRVEYWLREGDPAAEILSEASAKGCDLIALATHGWTGLDRFVMGSVAQKVLKGADCPVLAVRILAEEPARIHALHQEQHV